MVIASCILCFPSLSSHQQEHQWHVVHSCILLLTTGKMLMRLALSCLREYLHKTPFRDASCILCFPSFSSHQQSTGTSKTCCSFLHLVAYDRKDANAACLELSSGIFTQNSVQEHFQNRTFAYILNTEHICASQKVNTNSLIFVELSAETFKKVSSETPPKRDLFLEIEKKRYVCFEKSEHEFVDFCGTVNRSI